MKRNVPLLIMFIAGMVLIVSTFVPPAQELKEDITVWFDILAAVAFVLGGGNLLMMHLSKISNLRAGWGYSAVTLVAFLITLVVGLLKVGVSPAENSENHGWVQVPLAVQDFPVRATVVGQLPADDRGPIRRLVNPHHLPPIVEGQLFTDNSAGDSQVIFQGWMRKNQQEALRKFHLDNDWHAIVDKLFQQTQPPAEDLKSRLSYNAQLATLSFQGVMTAEQQALLLELGKDQPVWQETVNQLFTLSQQKHVVSLADLPAEQAELLADITIPEKLKSSVELKAKNELIATGPMQPEDRAKLIALARSKPDEQLTKAEIEEFETELLKRGPLTADQKYQLETFKTTADSIGLRNRELLFWLLGVSARETEKAVKAGITITPPKLSPEQKRYLMQKFNSEELPWQQKVDELFYKSQQPKYVWSGTYNQEGSIFWYVFQYAIVPLTATMFALLAFYVASAAFRAFRAKNVEATLLLGTAFLILLGNTYAGRYMTNWIPDGKTSVAHASQDSTLTKATNSDGAATAKTESDWFRNLPVWLKELITGLRLENLSATIMSIFNTAGTRAIMIGIALGIASTSLKVLLGIDRSYLGSD